jgi:DNA-binding CsgD family transcriptional regulator
MSRIATLRIPADDSQALVRGREAFRRQAWAEAVSELVAADREKALDPQDLVQLAQASLLTGREREGTELLARAHQGFFNCKQSQPAARSAFWLGFMALLNGDMAQASGWLARAQRLIQDQDWVEKGYLLLPMGFRAVHGGDAANAFEIFAQAAAIGERFTDSDLMALARQGQGRSLIRQGEIARGVALLDEAMVAVTAGEVTPLTAGGVYCSVIEACGEIFDLRRAQEWTSALEQWCNAQPDMVPYRGHCLVRRAEILRLHGAWPDAIEQATKACQKFTEPTPKVEAGAAYYQLAELHRLRGEFDAAEEAYQHAGRWIRVPQPGLAMLRFAQGQMEAARAAIRRIAEEVHEPGNRARILDSYVEIMVAVDDVPSARAAANELATITLRFRAPLLDAMSARAIGTVLLAEKDAKGALAQLRRSWAIWCELDAPYEAARTRVLMAQACGELDDCDTATQELELAREVFARLGAAPDLARVQAMSQTMDGGADHLLTAREIQVLKLVATGKTNRAIAVKLNISEKTVARHLSNIFNKLDLSSRAAATAFAYQNQLV